MHDRLDVLHGHLRLVGDAAGHEVARLRVEANLTRRLDGDLSALRRQNDALRVRPDRAGRRGSTDDAALHRGREEHGGGAEDAEEKELRRGHGLGEMARSDGTERWSLFGLY